MKLVCVVAVRTVYMLMLLSCWSGMYVRVVECWPLLVFKRNCLERNDLYRISTSYSCFQRSNGKTKNLLYAFFWVIPLCLNYICRRFGTLSVPSSYLSAYEDGTGCSETSAYKIQTPGNYPEESIQHSEQGECLKSRIQIICVFNHKWRTLNVTSACTEQESNYLNKSGKYKCFILIILCAFWDFWMVEYVSISNWGSSQGSVSSCYSTIKEVIINASF